MIKRLRRWTAYLRARIGIWWTRRVEREYDKDAEERSDILRSVQRMQAEVDVLRRKVNPDHHVHTRIGG